MSKLDINALLDLSDMPEGDTELAVFEMPDLPEITSTPENRAEDLGDDYKAARATVHFQQQLQKLAAVKVFESLAGCDNPKMVAAFTDMMASMTSTNKQMLDIQKQMKEITQEKGSVGPAITTTGDVYVAGGSFMSEAGSQSDQIALDARKEKDITDADYQPIDE